MIKHIITIAALGLAFGLRLQAQPAFSGGFRAGMTFGTIKGPSEKDAQGKDLEKFAYSTGLHVGATFNYKLTSMMGVRGEILYAQRGMNYEYEGPSYWIFSAATSAPVVAGGTRTMRMDVTNSYLEVPLSIFLKIDRLELSAGASGGLLVGSRAFGELTFGRQNVPGAPIEPFTVNLEFDYLKNGYLQTMGNQTISRTVGGRQVAIPQTIGAYYEAIDNGEKLYHKLDFGLTGGLSFYLSKSLFVGGRIYHSLSDVTNEQQDLLKFALNPDLSYATLNHKDRNLVWYLSLGFNL